MIEGWSLAIDPVKLHKRPPANSGGWSLFYSGEFVKAGFFYSLKDLPEYSSAYGLRAVCYEWPSERGKDSPVKQRDLFDLCWCCVEVASLFGVPAVKVPVSWKKSVPKRQFHAMIRAKLSPEELKLLDDQLNSVPAYKADNILDAVGIGLHANGRKII